MRLRPLGDTGLRVSELSFGAMTFGGGMGPISRVLDAKSAERMVGAALDAGVNFFDTANVYGLGESEELLGRALGARREEALIATKVGFPTGQGPTERGLCYRHVVGQAEASLRRLGTDRIDLFQIHKHDTATPFEETARALDDLVRRGLVRHLGFCNLPAWEAALALGLQRERGFARFGSAQMYYSLVGRDVEQEVVPLLERAGLGLLVWSPLAAGFLTGRYRAGVRSGGRRDEHAFPPVEPELGARALAALDEIADARGATPAQLALAWLLAKPAVSSVIIGASSVEQLGENLKAAELTLGEAELAALDAATEPPALYPRSFYQVFPDD